MLFVDVDEVARGGADVVFVVEEDGGGGGEELAFLMEDDGGDGVEVAGTGNRPSGSVRDRSGLLLTAGDGALGNLPSASASTGTVTLAAWVPLGAAGTATPAQGASSRSKKQERRE